MGLVEKLDAYLAITDGEEHAFYDQFNKLNAIRHVVLLYIEGEAVACGAIKEFNESTVEIKRMYTREAHRGYRLAPLVLEQLEEWALELGYRRCILETGLRQTAAIRLYERCGYTQMPCYGQYTNMANSRCYEKKLSTVP
nr:GNAT family N-acetyltransferase [Robertkochia marina]